MPFSVTLAATSFQLRQAVNFQINTTSAHYRLVVWLGRTPILSEANDPNITQNLSPGRYRAALTFNGPSGTPAEIAVTVAGVTKKRSGAVGPNGASGHLNRMFTVL